MEIAFAVTGKGEAMDDLIRRHAAIKALVLMESKNKSDGFSDEYDIISRTKATIEISNLPSAQAQRKRGKWEIVSQHENPPTYIYSCSECRHKSFGFYNFCPNCGARMEEEK
jgi:hypothetical protein